MAAPEPKSTVLLIDDEPVIAKMAGRRLEQAGYRVLTAADGERGLIAARVEHPDLILMDVMMPRLNGHDVLRMLKEDPETKAIPVIMLTAKGTERDMAASIQYGAVYHMSKPYQPMELLAEVKTALEQSRARTGGRRSSGPHVS